MMIEPSSVSEYHICSASSVSTLSSSVTLYLNTTLGLGVDGGKYAREGRIAPTSRGLKDRNIRRVHFQTMVVFEQMKQKAINAVKTFRAIMPDYV